MLLLPYDIKVDCSVSYHTLFEGKMKLLFSKRHLINMFEFDRQLTSYF